MAVRTTFKEMGDPLGQNNKRLSGKQRKEGALSGRQRGHRVRHIVEKRRERNLTENETTRQGTFLIGTKMTLKVDHNNRPSNYSL
jgi:hypothetical protein